MIRPAKVDGLLGMLRRSPAHGGVFNPWYERDAAHECRADAPEVRRRQLRHFLVSRLKRARILLLGEAMGYQGGHFSGIPMTSERILLGHHADRRIQPEAVLPGLTASRTSKAELKPRGFTEPTATIVWGCLLGLGLKGTEFVLWNAFPWHAFDPDEGVLSNRNPRRPEVAEAQVFTRQVLAMFPQAPRIAVGQLAAAQLQAMGEEHMPVRHPAQGGAGKFRRQIRSILDES